MRRFGRKTRSLAIALTAVLSVSTLFTGCGSKEETSNVTTSEYEWTNTSTPEPEESAEAAAEQEEQNQEQTVNYKFPSYMKWWGQDKFGMFIHLGSYSELGHGEWAMNVEKMSKKDYQTKVSKNFNPVRFNAETIAKYAKLAGMKYIVITAKHHEGFSMWNTHVASFTDYTGRQIYSLQKYSKFAGTGRDILRELKNACSKYGLHFGLYYSILDWNHKSQKTGSNFTTMSSMTARRNYINDMKAQLKELVTTYNPEILWFDGDWTQNDGKPTLQSWWTKRDGQALYKYLKGLNSNLIINERVCRGFGLGDFECPENEIPQIGSIPKRPWETCRTMNSAWGYNKTKEQDYLPNKRLIQDFVTTVSRGGNYLLNIGPKGDGSMTNGSKIVLRGFGAWMRTNKESIYGTKPNPFGKDEKWGTYTTKGENLYAHVFKWPDQASSYMIEVQKDSTRVVHQVSILGSKYEPKFNVNGNVVQIWLPKKPVNAIDTVVKITY